MEIYFLVKVVTVIVIQTFKVFKESSWNTLFILLGTPERTLGVF